MAVQRTLHIQHGMDQPVVPAQFALEHDGAVAAGVRHSCAMFHITSAGAVDGDCSVAWRHIGCGFEPMGTVVAIEIRHFETTVVVAVDAIDFGVYPSAGISDAPRVAVVGTSRRVRDAPIVVPPTGGSRRA